MKSHKSTILTIFLLFLILTIFNICRIERNDLYKIVKVQNGDEFFVDFNRNNKADKDELVKLYDIESFHSHKSYKTKYQQKTAGLTVGEALGLGILAKDFSQKEFLNKFIKIEFKDIEASKNKPYSIAKIYLQDKDIAIILLENGFATAGRKEKEYKMFFNMVKLTENKEKLKEQNIVILNPKSNIYHKLDCKHINDISKAYAIRVKTLPKESQPCENCFKEKIKKSKKKSNISKPNLSFVVKNFDFVSGNLHFYFTDFNKRLKPDNQCLNDGCKILLNEINNAKNSIDFSMYGIANQPKIIKALVSAQKRGVKVRWVTDSDTKGNNIYEEIKTIQKLLPNYVTDNHNPTSDPKQNTKYTNSIMHNKFFIFDKKSVWTGSANISQTDLADFNNNIIIFANSPILARIYEQEFEQMYNKRFHNLKSQIPNKENIKIDNQNNVSVYFSPTDKIITTKIIPKINQAQKYIYVSSFIITHQGIKKALLDAQARGVDVKIITDATSAGGKFSIHKELRNNKIPVKVENKAGKLHTKALVIDDEYSIIGSMNLTKSGEEKNDENVIIFYNPIIAKNMKNQFLYIWSSIPDYWLKHTPRAEAPESIGSCNDGIDNDFDGLIDNEDTGCIVKKK